MRIALIIGCLLSLTSIFCFSQENNNFSLEGSVDIDTGKIRFELVGDSTYYPEVMRGLQVEIVDGKFLIKGHIEQPLAFQISTNDGTLTEIFVLDTGRQKIHIKSQINKSTPQIDNSIMSGDYEKYSKSFEKARLARQLLDSKWDSLSAAYQNNIPDDVREQLNQELRQSYREYDMTLLNFVKENPDSYYALWKLIVLTKFGYENIFNPIYDQFSDSLKNSSIGRKVRHHLSEYNLTSLAKKLQDFSATDIEGNKSKQISYETNKYTLLDFWYSNCGPCIAQFQHLGLIYKDYRSRGLEIVGISTDKMARKENWQEVIKNHELKWPQLLDVNGVESSKLGISVFPSNFLVNSSGEIVGVNLRPSELKSYLDSH